MKAKTYLELFGLLIVTVVLLGVASIVTQQTEDGGLAAISLRPTGTVSSVWQKVAGTNDIRYDRGDVVVTNGKFVGDGSGLTGIGGGVWQEEEAGISYQGEVTIGSGKNLVFTAEGKDAGDIVFRDGFGDRRGHIWTGFQDDKELYLSSEGNNADLTIKEDGVVETAHSVVVNGSVHYTGNVCKRNNCGLTVYNCPSACASGGTDLCLPSTPGLSADSACTGSLLSGGGTCVCGGGDPVGRLMPR